MSLTPSRGSTIAKIIGHNVKASNRFDPMVNMWVYEEMMDGKKLTEIINTQHENVKYLPGHKLPRNVVSAANQRTFDKQRRRDSAHHNVELLRSAGNAQCWRHQIKIRGDYLWTRAVLNLDTGWRFHSGSACSEVA